MDDRLKDIIIIGGGPAGLSAAIYTAREGFNTILLEKGICGGLPATTDLIENYPGFPDGINGMRLINNFKEQALRFGTSIGEYNEVRRIKPVGKRINVQTTKQAYSACAVIIASGSIPKKLNISGEEEYAGKGVSYCVTCDGPFFKDKHVAVVGCGNSGLQEGGALLKYVRSLTFIELLPHMTGEKILQERLQKNEKTRFLLNHMLTSIDGNTLVNSVTVKNRQTHEIKKIEVSGVFIYAGFLPNSTFWEGIVELDDLGYIITNEEMETSAHGIYAVGDIRSKKVRQIDVACGEGTIAALSVRDYINKLEDP